MWLSLWRAFLSALDARRRLDWSEAFLDGTFAPAKRGRRPRQDTQRKGTKLMVLVDGTGVPLGVHLAPANLTVTSTTQRSRQ